MDPYQIIDWVPPEGGGGPQYRGHVSGVHWSADRPPRLAAKARSDRRGRLSDRRRALPDVDLAGRRRRVLRGTGPWRAASRSWRSGTAGFSPASTTSRDRGIVVMTSQNFDGEWIAGIMARFGFGAARGSTSRGGARALVQLRRDLDGRTSGGLHGRRPARAGARRRSPARSGWRARPAIRSCRSTSRRIAAGRCRAGIERRSPSRSPPRVVIGDRRSLSGTAEDDRADAAISRQRLGSSRSAPHC